MQRDRGWRLMAEPDELYMGERVAAVLVEINSKGYRSSTLSTKCLVRVCHGRLSIEWVGG